MPELSEVVYSCNQWAPGLGRKVLSLSLHPGARVFRDLSHPEARLPKAIEGRRFTSARTHGKQLLFQFGSQTWLTAHLGMTGVLCATHSGHAPGKHDHLVLRQRERHLVFTDPRMFGSLRLHEGSAPPLEWTNLPPEILSPGFTTLRLADFLSRRAGSPLKSLLLEQDMFPGIGNWMADEILWRARLHPSIPAGTLSPRDVALLRRTTRGVARGALVHVAGRPLQGRGHSSHRHHAEAPGWGSPPKTWLFAHRWEDGGHCPRCRTLLVRASIRQRTTCWCPSCQADRR